MSPRTLTLQGQVPIPVGNRIEVVFFLLRTGLFSGAMSRDEWKPLVRDLVTGITYGRQYHFTNDDALAATEIPLTSRADLQVAERFLARVLATRILHGKLPDHGTRDWVTTLLVDPEAP